MSRTQILVSAGEVSGDLFLALLAGEIRRREPEAILYGIASRRSAEAGVEVLADLALHNTVGLQESAPYALPGSPYRKAYRLVENLLRDRRPDVIVLVNNQGFNLKLANLARRLKIRTLYFIPPPIWIWGPWQGKNLARLGVHVLSLYPREAEAYKQAGARVTFVGHPIKDWAHPPADRAGLRKALGLEPDRPLLGILPGSRTQEIRNLTPLLSRAASMLAAEDPSLQVVLPLASPLLADTLNRAMEREPKTFRILEANRRVIAACDALATCSGTVTLEAACVGTPFVAVYRTSRLTYALGRLLGVRYITMPNLILNRPAAVELLQQQAEPETLAEAIRDILPGGKRRESMIRDLAEASAALGESGATARAAEVILGEAKDRN